MVNGAPGRSLEYSMYSLGAPFTMLPPRLSHRLSHSRRDASIPSVSAGFL